MQAKAQERGVILRVHLDPALPFLTGDPICLRECLLNLMTNALEACDPGQGRVEIATTATGNGRFQISVRDNGRGIAPEDHDKLFQPFFTTKGREGLGLGLAVTHKIIREHRGEIRVESAPGQGTCFTLDLPLEPGLE
jgi:signal transduction histidine kinase